jgi:shikimate dehydrogenase
VINKGGRLLGRNTDIEGWVDDVQQQALLSRKCVCVLGAGGAARAVAYGAAMAGADSVRVVNRTLSRAEELASELGGLARGSFTAYALDESGRAAVETCDILVNTTSVGMAVQPGIPIPSAWLRPSTFVYDTIYRDTELLAAARKAGCATRNGVGMLARQGARAFELWTGTYPDVSRMERLLSHHLAQQRP